MTERATWMASVLWLLTAFLFLVLPIFLPSSPNPSGFPSDTISISTGVMYVLSFPGGLLSLLLSPIVVRAFGIDPDSMPGRYLNLKLMFVLGLAQSYWFVPKLLRGAAHRKALISSLSPVCVLSEMQINDDAAFVAGRERSPLERVFDEADRP